MITKEESFDKIKRMMEKRLLVFGAEDWDNPGRVFVELQDRRPDVVIFGGSPGVDAQAEITARRFNIPFISFYVNYKEYGRKAREICNKQMIDEGKPTEAIGFHHDISKSKGSKDMLERCKKAGIPVEIIS